MRAIQLPIVALAVSLVSPLTAAENSTELLSADQILVELEKPKQGKLAETILHVVSHSLGAANAELEFDGKAPLYCVPDRLALTVEQNRSIFEVYLSRAPEMGELPYFMVMLSALQETFPCEL